MNKFWMLMTNWFACLWVPWVECVESRCRPSYYRTDIYFATYYHTVTTHGELLTMREITLNFTAEHQLSLNVLLLVTLSDIWRLFNLVSFSSPASRKFLQNRNGLSHRSYYSKQTNNDFSPIQQTTTIFTAYSLHCCLNSSGDVSHCQ